MVTKHCLWLCNVQTGKNVNIVFIENIAENIFRENEVRKVFAVYITSWQYPLCAGVFFSYGITWKINCWIFLLQNYTYIYTVLHTNNAYPYTEQVGRAHTSGERPEVSDVNIRALSFPFATRDEQIFDIKVFSKTSGFLLLWKWSKISILVPLQRKQEK